jgi:hypothetical protein
MKQIVRGDLAPSLNTIYALHAQMTGEVQAIVTACRELLRQSPELISIIHATKLLEPYSYLNGYYTRDQLFWTRFVLDLSWDNILECICPLSQLITHENVLFRALFLSLPAILSELDHLYPVAIVSRDLACGFLRLLQQIGAAERPLGLW